MKHPSGHEKRLIKLEETLGLAGDDEGRCLECGRLPDGESGPHDTYEILFPHEFEELGIERPHENVYCEACGRLVFGIVESPGMTLILSTAAERADDHL